MSDLEEYLDRVFDQAIEEKMLDAEGFPAVQAMVAEDLMEENDHLDLAQPYDIGEAIGILEDALAGLRVDPTYGSREFSLAHTRMEEAGMWFQRGLEFLDEQAVIDAEAEADAAEEDAAEEEEGE